MKEIIMNKAEVGELRRLTDVGYGTKVEGKNMTQKDFTTPYFEEVRHSMSLDEVREIYERDGFKIIHTA